MFLQYLGWRRRSRASKLSVRLKLSSSSRCCPADFQALWGFSDEREPMLPALDSSDCYSLTGSFKTLNTNYPKPETYMPNLQSPLHIWKGPHPERRPLKEIRNCNLRQNRVSAYFLFLMQCYLLCEHLDKVTFYHMNIFNGNKNGRTLMHENILKWISVENCSCSSQS